MKNQKYKRWPVLVGSIVLSTVTFLTPVAKSQVQEWFITPQEAAMASLPKGDQAHGGGYTEIGRSDLSFGPVIEVENPIPGKPLPSPLNIVVKFTPREHPVDVSTLKVSLVKFITLDITDRIEGYVTEKGIQREGANIPSGEHRVRISVADTSGAVSTKEFLFEVL